MSLGSTGRRLLPALLLLLAAAPLPAAEPYVDPRIDARTDPRADPRYRQLEQDYGRLERDQQTAYQQFMMAQELRRNELANELPGAGFGPLYRAPGAIDSRPPLDYDENQRRQRERQERLQRLDRDVTESYNRYQELGRQKQSIQDQMRALTPVR